MTPVQKNLARHALGLDGRHKQTWRNHFVTGEGSTDYPHWVAMVEAGWATRRTGSVLTGGDDLFRLTRAGAELAVKRGEALDPEAFPVVPA
ncbi:hypothetical protein MesoLj131c_62650 [Mesorhizobium sp. 131-3-5]|uniref:hypothetical protein n=1 Tax=Mesorhizobium sp. 131-3-5 TaxID=2744520 RepID=UPI0019277FD8|nr:hypothetical protein [Mesorhizobium sp. 131-3-5]BCH12007.1 hypothetical protein MesoLj131c_62650 [Mesorhizobium sp. 131-3-5]